MKNIYYSTEKDIPTSDRPHTQDQFLAHGNYLVGEDLDVPRGGACSGMDTSLFFPILKNGRWSTTDIVAQKEAIELCRSCSIRQKCLLYSLEYEPHGIWGGFTESTRALLAHFWKITNKRTWAMKASFMKYRKIVDYIVHPEDIDFIKKVAHDKNFAQPPFDEWAGIPSAARRRYRKSLADSVNR